MAYPRVLLVISADDTRLPMLAGRVRTIAYLHAAFKPQPSTDRTFVSIEFGDWRS